VFAKCSTLENAKKQLRLLRAIEFNKSFTPLKKSIRTRIDSSTKLPVTDLNRAPQRGADSNLYRYKLRPKLGSRGTLRQKR